MYTMYFLIAIIVLAGLIAAFSEMFGKKGASDEAPKPSASACDTCLGGDTMCEAECLLREQVKPVEYYNDEELDRYQHRDAEGYKDEEVEEFSEVLYTLKPTEIRGWLHSLDSRSIALPIQLKDEALALIQ